MKSDIRFKLATHSSWLWTCTMLYTVLPVLVILLPSVSKVTADRWLWLRLCFNNLLFFSVTPVIFFQLLTLLFTKNAWMVWRKWSWCIKRNTCLTQCSSIISVHQPRVIHLSLGYCSWRAFIRCLRHIRFSFAGVLLKMLPWTFRLLCLTAFGHFTDNIVWVSQLFPGVRLCRHNFNELCADYNHFTHLYTDGSKMGDGVASKNRAKLFAYRTTQASLEQNSMQSAWNLTLYVAVGIRTSSSCLTLCLACQWSVMKTPVCWKKLQSTWHKWPSCETTGKEYSGALQMCGQELKPYYTIKTRLHSPDKVTTVSFKKINVWSSRWPLKSFISFLFIH